MLRTGHILAFFFIGVILTIFITPSAFAETFFPSIYTEIEKPPTYCIVEPPAYTGPENIIQGYVNRFFDAVQEWKQKLMEAESGNRDKWLIKIKLVTEGSVINDEECTIPVRLAGDSAEAAGNFCWSNSHLYFPKLCPNPPKEGFPWIRMSVLNFGT